MLYKINFSNVYSMVDANDETDAREIVRNKGGKEPFYNFVTSSISSIQEIKDLKDIPLDWANSIPYSSKYHDDMTCSELILKNEETEKLKKLLYQFSLDHNLSEIQKENLLKLTDCLQLKEDS